LHLPYKEGHAGLVPECPALHTIITMISEKIIEFIEKKLSIMEVEELEKELLNNPDLLEVLGGLTRIKKELPADTSLDDHLKKKKAEIKEKIMTQQPIPIEHKHDDRIDCIIRSMKLARRKLEIDSVTPKNINDQEISDLLYDLEEASTE